MLTEDTLRNMSNSFNVSTGDYILLYDYRNGKNISI